MAECTCLAFLSLITTHHTEFCRLERVLPDIVLQISYGSGSVKEMSPESPNEKAFFLVLVEQQHELSQRL